MNAWIFYLSPIFGFLFMLTLIMTFVAKAAGRKVSGLIKGIFFGSLVIIIAMFTYISL
ncbi:hypothetical protein MUN89_18440 [Halobacillus salinarum]|uniref:Uncharacterized protein n=1 Tax=Halobacillus salinarum TaxID=2932257 RepID=A0ABY4EI81_9BACI|nr:hypothetical protein [Halobacillus salinarum]UOQ43834.1 hypothetical protein MUN89_18440 [Halobacillus salinarum]